eukprot:1159780-Pelagomonas_calceolata.AAC.2
MGLLLHHKSSKQRRLVGIWRAWLQNLDMKVTLVRNRGASSGSKQGKGEALVLPEHCEQQGLNCD